MVLRDELLRDRKWSPKTEGARGDFQARRGLLAFVLVAIDQERNFANQLQIEAVMIGNLLGAPQVFDISL